MGSNERVSKMKISLEDTIMIKGKYATAGSLILKNYKAVFTATIVERLETLGATLSIESTKDEFGISSLEDETVDIADGISRVKDGRLDALLNNDVFGKKRRLTPLHGLCYLRPTYGTVSRYGLIPAVSSMDQIGITSRSTEDAFAILETIGGHDTNDGTSIRETINYSSKDIQADKLRIAIVENSFVDDKVDECLTSLKAMGITADKIKLKYLNKAAAILYILSCAEISNNISRYDGIKYGLRIDEGKGINDLYIKTRTEGLGINSKLAAIMGSMVLSQDYYEKYYDKAMRIRGLIKEEFDNAMADYDCIILSQYSNKTKSAYDNMAASSIAPLTGAPSLSVNACGIEGGIQVLSDVKNDMLLRVVGNMIEKDSK